MRHEGHAGEPPVPVLDDPGASSEPSWHIPSAADAAPMLFLAYDLTRAARMRAAWHRLPLHGLCIVPFSICGPVITVVMTFYVGRYRPNRSPLQVAFSSLLWSSVGAVMGLALWLAGACLVAALRRSDGPRLTVRMDAEGVHPTAPRERPGRIPWAQVRGVEVRGSGDVVFRRGLTYGGNFRIDRCAFGGDRDAARRFATAALLFQEGRGAEIPEDTQREFAAPAAATEPAHAA